MSHYDNEESFSFTDGNSVAQPMLKIEDLDLSQRARYENNTENTTNNSPNKVKMLKNTKKLNSDIKYHRSQKSAAIKNYLMTKEEIDNCHLVQPDRINFMKKERRHIDVRRRASYYNNLLTENEEDEND